jgi:hypothetical protein
MLIGRGEPDMTFIMFDPDEYHHPSNHSGIHLESNP